MPTNAYIRHVKNNHWPPFDGKLWQRGYFDHVIRDKNELNNIREYIETNPLKWDHDLENVHNLA